MSDFALVVRDGRGRPRIAVEVKRTRGRDAAWARAWRQRREDDAAEPAIATMLLTLDRAFIWPASAHGAAPALATRASELKVLANQLTTDYFQNLELRWAEVMRSLDAKLVCFPASFVSAIRDSESELKSPDFLIAQATLAHAAATSVGTHELGFLTHDKAMKDWAESSFEGWACFSSFEAARGWALRSVSAPR
jgi:hypothetical protein